jgi:hypothetical protein
MDPAATIAAWRERGDQHFDPVRFRLIEVLAGKAAGHRGDARRILDGRLLELLAAYREGLDSAPSAEAPGAPNGPPRRGPFAELLDHLARHASSHGDSPSELKTLRDFRSTWSRLSADRRLTQSLAKVPENAGPLHSHHLVHRSLTLMRELSPEYLDRFMSYVDALLWLDQVQGGEAVTGKETVRAESHRKPARGKSADCAAPKRGQWLRIGAFLARASMDSLLVRPEADGLAAPQRAAVSSAGVLCEHGLHDTWNVGGAAGCFKPRRRS